MGTSADEVFPAVAVLAGRVAVSYYTRAYDPNGIGLDYAMSVGWGNGVASARVRRITTATQNPQVQFVGVGLVSGAEIQGTFIGDYTAIAMGLDFKLHPCWTDFRGRPGINTPNQDILHAVAVRFLMYWADAPGCPPITLRSCPVCASKCTGVTACTPSSPVSRLGAV